MRVAPVLSWLVLVGVPTTVVAEPEPSRVPELLAQWKHRREAVSVVRYVVRVQPGPARGEAGDGPATGMAGFDFAARRLRMDLDKTVHFANRREPWSRSRWSIRSDGREVTFFLKIDNDAATAPAEPLPEGIHTAAWGTFNQWPGDPTDLTPLLWAHGIFWTEENERASAAPFDWQPGPKQFAPAGREVIAGRPCSLFYNTRPPAGGLETVGIDPGRNGAVVLRRQVWTNGYTTETAVDYRETPHGWLPAGWTVRSLGPNRPEAVEYRVTVEAATFDAIPVEEFRYEPKPGMRVYTAAGVFVVGEDGTREVVPPAVNYASLSFGQKLGRGLPRAGWELGGLLALLAALVGVFVWLRRRRIVAGGTP